MIQLSRCTTLDMGTQINVYQKLALMTVSKKTDRFPDYWLRNITNEITLLVHHITIIERIDPYYTPAVCLRAVCLGLGQSLNRALVT